MTTAGGDEAHKDVIARLKAAAKGDAARFENMTIEDARARYARSQDIRQTVSAALEVETARRRALVEKCIALGRVVPPAPEVDASAGHDASVIDDNALNITDASSVDDVKKALAASQALARVKLHEAKVARAHCDVMEAALATSES